MPPRSSPWTADAGIFAAARNRVPLSQTTGLTYACPEFKRRTAPLRIGLDRNERPGPGQCWRAVRTARHHVHHGRRCRLQAVFLREFGYTAEFLPTASRNSGAISTISTGALLRLVKSGAPAHCQRAVRQMRRHGGRQGPCAAGRERNRRIL